MNEQPLADELDALLDGQLRDTINLPAEDALFAAELNNLAARTQVDATFADALETRLHTADSTFADRQSNTSRRRTIMSNRYVRGLTTAAAVLSIIIAATLTIPPLRTLAQDVFNLLFQRTPADTVAFATPIVIDMRPTPVASAPTYTPLSIAEVEGKAGYNIHIPSVVPAGYVLTDVSYDDPQARQSSLFYTHGERYGLVIAQMPAVYAKPLEVGATAAIQQVEIGNVSGEYVEGSWRVNPEVSGDTMTLTEQTWDADFPFQQLRWQKGDRVYWMMSVSGQGTDLTLDDWLEIANSLG